MMRQRVLECTRSLRMAAWLGWQIESNWASPFLFAVYSIAKPVAGALILVFMYTVIARGGLRNPLFPQIFVGNAFYIYVAMVLMGVSQAVVEDREGRDFLDALGIPNEKGVVEDLPGAVDDVKLKAAVDLLLAKHPPEVVAVYLNAFNDMNEANWPNLKTMLEADARLQLGGQA